ncbi:hypothetical protein NDU88_002555 [Pleurodeles waltl]|uniref:Uncharacterized protein n=1 Tax=Pleurodeles waltl TaxID=8319 RepID=A0AAV7TMA3_PLEWA|nr:hypothetical protein NDU88_002555 [Pleurodeles waltl]
MQGLRTRECCHRKRTDLQRLRFPPGIPAVRKGKRSERSFPSNAAKPLKGKLKRRFKAIAALVERYNN